MVNVPVLSATKETVIACPGATDSLLLSKKLLIWKPCACESMLHTTSFTVSPLLTVTNGQAFVGAPWEILSLKPVTLAMMRCPPGGFWHPAGRFCVDDVLPVLGWLPGPNLKT